MKEKNLIPALRFKGFTETWEQRKLGELSEIIGGGTPSTQNPEYWDGEINWYAPAEIGESIYVKSSKRRITKLGLEKSSAKLLPVGTVLFTSRAGIGNTAILKTEGTTNQGFQSIVPIIGKLDSYFIYSRTKELKQYAEKVGAGSTFVEVSRKQMSEAPFLFPQVSEQKSIGSFFSTIDRLITLQQRELESLKETKKTLLSKMFPKKGETIPEVRFPGFTDAWEQRKLSELMDFSNGINADKESYGKGRKMLSVLDILSESKIEYKNIHNSVSVSEEIEHRNKVEYGDLVFVRSSEIVSEVGWAKSYRDNKYALFSGFVIRGKKKTDFDSFFLELVLNYHHRRQIENRAGGSTRFNVSQDILSKIEVKLPTIQVEVNEISSFFSTLDHLITLQQRKLELLKMQKQTLLKLMFPR